MVKRLKAKDANLGRRSKGSGKRGKPHKRRKPREPEPVDPDAAPVAPPPTEGPGRYDPLATTGGANPMAAAKCFTARGTTAAEAARDGPIPYLEQHQLTIEGGGQAEAGPLVPIQKFADAPFRRPLRALLSSRYQTPTPIQAVAWPLLTAGHDLVAIAKTGSGKTCAYLLPIINGTAAGHGGEKLAASGGVQAVVLAPTRELTAQIADEARRFAEVAQPPVEVCCFTGGDGTKLAVQLHELRARPENTGSGGGAAARRVLCATPGRLSALLELAEKGAGGAASVVGAVRVLVLDEADRLLEMGFERQLHAIVSLLPPQTQRQTLFFSATWPAAVRAAAAKLTRAQALRLRLGRDDGAGAGGLRVNADVKQTIQVLEDEAQKTARLKLMLAPWAASARAKPAGSPTGMPRVLVFVNTKKLCTALGAVLAQEGVRVDALHSEREQVVRTEVVRAFSKGRIDVLVATDVASRGLDLPGLAVVINYDFPPAVGQAALEGYVHRVGRTGRLGQQGVQQGRAFTFIHPDTDAHAAHGLSALLRDAGQPVPRELAELDDGGVMAARGGARAQRKREAESNQSLYQAIERAMQNEEKQKIQLRRERQKKKAEIGGGGGGKNKKRKGSS